MQPVWIIASVLAYLVIGIIVYGIIWRMDKGKPSSEDIALIPFYVIAWPAFPIVAFFWYSAYSLYKLFSLGDKE